jgi:cytochrome c peroxidase
MATAIRGDSAYRVRFAALYRDTVTEANIRNALADYVRTLIPFDSRFDRAMRGDGEETNTGAGDTLTPTEISGFNLFMGKAKCATCHFPPTFNGTLPPDYSDTEFEHLGVPAEASALQPRKLGSARPAISPDLGRFHYLGTAQRKHFFKTPTVRNAALTFPYMHNGVFASLEEVIDFYNVGGGRGLGIMGPETEFQTLPADSLGLTASEKQDLIAFMKSLTDRVPMTQR